MQKFYPATNRLLKAIDLLLFQTSARWTVILPAGVRTSYLRTLSKSVGIGLSAFIRVPTFPSRWAAHSGSSFWKCQHRVVLEVSTPCHGVFIFPSASAANRFGRGEPHILAARFGSVNTPWRGASVSAAPGLDLVGPDPPWWADHYRGPLENCNTSPQGLSLAPVPAAPEDRGHCLENPRFPAVSCMWRQGAASREAQPSWTSPWEAWPRPPTKSGHACAWPLLSRLSVGATTTVRNTSH